jgi:subtilisin family serine protease
MIAPVPPGATLAALHPGNLVSPGYMELSGTSFAAPVVSAAAAQVLFKHPDWTPDQVKGALMLAASPLSTGNLAGGVGELYASDAVNLSSAPNANQALDQFVKTANSWNGQSYSFDSASWNSAAKASAAWNSASWNSAAWDSASWNSASWNSASWNSASWNSASWNSASWNSASWNSASMADAADGEFTPASSVTLSAPQVAAMLAAISF